MPNNSHTKPSRLPHLPDATGAACIEARIAAMYAAEDLDGLHIADQRADVVDMTAAAVLDCAFERLSISTFVAERAHQPHDGNRLPRRGMRRPRGGRGGEPRRRLRFRRRAGERGEDRRRGGPRMPHRLSQLP